MPKRKETKRAAGKRGMTAKELVLANEVDYIRNKAIARTGCVVAVGPLILFSTESGDAWMLDPADHLAAPLVRDGEYQSVSMAETDKTFAVDWRGGYEIDGDLFLYSDYDSARITSISGYPTAEILKLTRSISC
ncbi:MAG TPA: hypothetical protein VF020_16850 [Chthoniobacterales bacterium]